MKKFAANIGRFVARRWKAVVPLAVAGVSEALHDQFDLNTPHGRKQFLAAVAMSVLVHAVPNAPAPPAA